MPDRQALVAAGVGGLRTRVVLVVAGAYGGGLEIREGAAVDGEGGLGVACLGYLLPLTSLLSSSSYFAPLWAWGEHTGSAAAPPRAPANV